ncbi:MAG: GNAT family N-acetyltransferase [Synergistaceae bacterium]|jgi:ribosomal protein S18 acetylase RimI-like enzyme|nr:GNAT family N-acetyltransferase [Synergistaceae bacterium]
MRAETSKVMTKTEDYAFYDSQLAVLPKELQELYMFTYWGRSRSLDQIDRMLKGSNLCFSARCSGKLVAFCRMLTDFVFRGAIWDVLVHPDHQGKGIGSRLMNYALTHPAVKDVPVITCYASGLVPFLARHGFESREGLMVLQRAPIEYS